MTTTETLDDAALAQFTGSENWYRHSLNRNILYTDGAKYVADNGGACWLLDIIATMQLERKIAAIPFQVWKLALTTGPAATLICENGNDNEVYRQHIAFTDYPPPGIELWFQNNTIFLPSEY